MSSKCASSNTFHFIRRTSCVQQVGFIHQHGLAFACFFRLRHAVFTFVKPSSHGGVLFMQGEAKLPPATPNTFNVHPTGLPWFLYDRLRIRRWLSWFSFSLKTLRLPPFGLVNSGFFTACRKKQHI